MGAKDYDIIVIGAGIMGLSSAYYLKKVLPNKSILVIEKELTYSQGNSGRSVAGFRDFFSTSINKKLAKSSIKFYKHVQNTIGYDINLKDVGYLFLMSRKKYDSMKSIIATLTKSSDIRILNTKDISRIDFLVPYPKEEERRLMNLDPIEIGVLGRNCGVLDIDKLSSYYYNECKSLGIEFLFGAEVISIELRPKNPLEYPGEPFLWQDKIISEISTSKGPFSAEKFIFATGAWTGKLLDPIGVDSHNRVKKRFVYQIGGDDVKRIVNSSYGLNDEGLFPFTILPSHGIYLRPHPQSSSFWVSTSGTTSDQEIGRTFSYETVPANEYEQPREEYFVYNILPILKAYLNNLDDLKITGSWTGYYSLSTQDKTPYVFPFLNAVVATGGSGAGLMKSDSIGRIVASIASGHLYTTLFDGSRIKNSSLGVIDRKVGIESLRF